MTYRTLNDSPFGGILNTGEPAGDFIPATAPPEVEAQMFPCLTRKAIGYGPQAIIAENFDDHDGNPAGGWCAGIGFHIAWQNGPTRDQETGRKLLQDGAFVEDVTKAIIQRLEYYQAGKFASPFNEAALDHFRRGLVALESRRRDREARGVDGLHQA